MFLHIASKSYFKDIYLHVHWTFVTNPVHTKALRTTRIKIITTYIYFQSTRESPITTMTNTISKVSEANNRITANCCILFVITTQISGKWNMLQFNVKSNKKYSADMKNKISGELSLNQQKSEIDTKRHNVNKKPQAHICTAAKTTKRNFHKMTDDLGFWYFVPDTTMGSNGSNLLIYVECALKNNSQKHQLQISTFIVTCKFS